MKVNIAEILSLAKPSMSEIRYKSGDSLPDLSKYDILQLKYDGWFCVAVTTDGGNFDIYSRGKELIKSVSLPFKIDPGARGYMVLIGELMYGTNWALKYDPGKFYVHDIITGTEKTNYYDRHIRLSEFIKKVDPFNTFFIAVKSYPITKFADVWRRFVDDEGFEGVVLKSAFATGDPSETKCCKVKKTFTKDYVLMRITEGGGRLSGKAGALVGGLYRNGNLVEVCSVGGGMSDGMREEVWDSRHVLIGQVFEAYGWALFASGALRHPNFLRWRLDKTARECV